MEIIAPGFYPLKLNSDKVEKNSDAFRVMDGATSI
jgi:hypothetical protein